MVRVLVYLAVFACLAFGAVWLAVRPGEVSVLWQGSVSYTQLDVDKRQAPHTADRRAEGGDGYGRACRVG